MYTLPKRNAKRRALGAGATCLLILTLILPVGGADAQTRPSFKPGDQVLIAADFLNVLAQPDGGSTVVTQVTKGWLTKFLKANKDAQNNDWLYIGERAYGWIPASVNGKPSVIIYTDKAIAAQIANAAALIKSKPKSVDGYVARATAYLSLNNYKASVADYDKAIQLLPQEGELYELRGKAELDSHSFEKAVNDYLQAIRLGWKKPGTLNSLAWAYKGLEEDDEALDHNNQALAIASDWGLLYSDEANLYRRSKQIAKALDLSDKALQIDPLLWIAYELRAQIYQEQGNFDSFFKELDKAFVVDPLCADCYVMRGAHYADYERDYVKALEEFNKGLQAEPNNAYALGNRGVTYIQMGRLNSSIPDLKRAAVLDPALDFIPFNLGTAYGRSGQYKDALDAYTQAAALGGEHELSVYLYRPEIYIALGQYEEAGRDVAFYTTWPKKTTRADFEAFHSITEAVVNLYLTNYLAVAQPLQNAFDAYPDFVRYYTSIGRGYRSTPKREALIGDLKKTVKAKPKDTTVLLQLGNLEMEFGYWDDALNTYRAYLKIKPDENLEYMVAKLEPMFKP